MIILGVPTKTSQLTNDSTFMTSASTNTAITNAINNLDVAAIGGTGKYITTISETNGKISATSATMPTIPTKVSQLTNDSGYGKQISTVVVSGTTPTQTLQPNTFYEFGTVTKLTITLAAEVSGIYNEYMFEFTCGSTAATLALPSTIKWYKNAPLNIQANKKYQISIVNNLAVGGEF